MPAMTWTYIEEGDYTPGAGTMDAPTVTTFVGAGVRVRGVPLRYQTLELIESEAPTFLWTSQTYGPGTLPPLGSTTTFGETADGDAITYRALDIDPVDPDGGGHLVARIIARRA